jgi:peptidyl-prolyl cis-trans isomerase SurA
MNIIRNNSQLLLKHLKCYGIYLTIILIVLSSALLNAQQEEEYVVDEVVGVVGKNIILESDIETQYLSYRMQGGISGSASEIRCVILEDIMYQKLMVSQAEVDSIEVSDIQVEAELDRRLGLFINQFGSQEKMEAYYDKTMVEIKQELYEIVKDQLITQQVQSEIIANVTVTPSEIRSYFRSLPNDSLPLIKTAYTIAEIVKKPPISVEERIRVKEQLLELRKRILEGESFSTMAILYSQDPGSAKNGGELGFYGRGQLYPEFEAVAFKLKDGEVSNIVETEAGYHIIQMIERKGDYINVRHILLVPQVSPEDLMEARQELDTVAQLIRGDSIAFEEAVKMYSDADNKNSDGLLINPYTGGTTFEAEQLDAQVSFTIEKMEVGELSNPVPMKTEDQKDAYRLLLLKEKTEPHKASLEQDYAKLQEWALQDKQRRLVDEWINAKARKTYIRINDRYKECAFTNEWNPR